MNLFLRELRDRWHEQKRISAATGNGRTCQLMDSGFLDWLDDQLAGGADLVADERPFAYWSRAEANIAIEEGWVLTNNSADCVCVSRLDNPADVEPPLNYTEPKFEGDEQAQGFVATRAANGSRMHILALYLCGFSVEESMTAPPAGSLLRLPEHCDNEDTPQAPITAPALPQAPITAPELPQAPITAHELLALLGDFIRAWPSLARQRCLYGASYDGDNDSGSIIIHTARRDTPTHTQEWLISSSHVADVTDEPA